MAEHLSSSIFIHPLLRIKHQVRLLEINVFGIHVFEINIFGIIVFEINVFGMNVCGVLAVGLHSQQCVRKTVANASEQPRSG